jgi:hypothetical protein
LRGCGGEDEWTPSGFWRGRVYKRIWRWAVGLVSQPANAGVRAIGWLGVSISVIRCRRFYH